MINVIPQDRKQSIRYSRRNSVLIRWMTGIGFAAVGIVLIAGAGIFLLRQESQVLQKEIVETKASLLAQDEAETLKRVSEISGNLKLVVDVLSREVLFSKLLQQIGLVMPPGTILQDLSLSRDLTGGIDLMIGAVSYDSATQAQVNLTDTTNGIFEKADIQGVTCDSTRTETEYICQAEIRALFTKDNNPFLLLSQGEDQ